MQTSQDERNSEMLKILWYRSYLILEIIWGWDNSTSGSSRH